MDKPIASSLIYRSKATNTALTSNPRTVTFDEGQTIQSTVQYILKSIVDKHSA